MKTEDISPFVRYVHTFSPSLELYGGKRRAYDHRLFFALCGSCTFDIAGTTYEMQCNDVLFIPSENAYRMIECTADTKLLGINFDLTRMASDMTQPILPEDDHAFASNRQLEQGLLEPSSPLSNALFIKKQPFLAACFYDLQTEFDNGKRYAEAINSARLKYILFSLLRYDGEKCETDDTVDAIILYIHQNYHRPMTNKEIGDFLNFHPNYLNRLMLKGTGKTIHQYLLNYRIHRAIDLLQATSKTVGEIAILVGFGDIRQFCRCFRKQIGVSPKAFKKGL